MPITRSAFLKGLAAAPFARCFGQSQPAQPQPRPKLPVPRQDDLILVSHGPQARVTLYSASGPFMTVRSPIAAGPRPTILLSHDRRKLFICFSPQPPERGQAQLAIVDLNHGGDLASYAYPGTLSPRGSVLAESADGRWLYTLTGRVHPSWRFRRPEQGGTPTEQAVIYTFETAASRFLPRVAETGHAFFDGIVILGGDDAYPVPAIGPVGIDTFESIMISEDGRGTPALPATSSKEPEREIPKGSFVCVLSPSGRLAYYIQSGGYILKSDPGRPGSTGSFGMEGLAPGRFYGEPAVSGDGKLLFVSTGPERTSAGPYDSPGTYDPSGNNWRHIARVSTYRMSDLVKIREQELQRPLQRIWANHDGSTLFATEEPTDHLLVLDADTLRLLGLILAPAGSVETIAVV